MSDAVSEVTNLCSFCGEECGHRSVEVAELRSLLSVAICPHCDGRGWYLGSGHVCRNEQECMERCPEPIQVQCEWCDRRSSACATPATPDPEGAQQ